MPAGGEWILVFFTLLSQIGVGIYLFSEGWGFLRIRRGDSSEITVFHSRSRLSVLVLLGLAGSASFLHLGQPSHFLNALNNLKTSWLSREILFLLLFLGTVVILNLISRLKARVTALERILSLLGGILGLALVFVMARLYMLPAVALWNSIGTPRQFFLTTFLLGSLGAALILLRVFTGRSPSLSEEPQEKKAPTRLLIQIALVLTVYLLLMTIFYWANTYKSLTVGGLPLQHSMLPIIIIRTALTALGGVFLILCLKNSGEDGKTPSHNSGFLITGFLILLAAEVLGRFLFFSLNNQVPL